MSSRIEEAHKLFEQGKSREAESLYSKILARDPSCVEAMLGLGLTWSFTMDSERQGLALIEVANELKPDDLVVKLDLAASLMRLKRYDEALPLIDHILSVDASHHTALNNKGILFKWLGKSPWERVVLHTLSIRSAEVRKQPPWPMYISRADAYADAGDFDRALADQDYVLANTPDDACVHFNRGCVLLSRGNYAEGFEEYHWRHKLFPHMDIGRTMDLPVWFGEDIAGKNLLVYNDQGFGDMIMMLRYMPLLRDLGANVTLMIIPQVGALARATFPWLTIVEEMSDTSGFDYRCPMFDLPLALKSCSDNIPALPYIQASRAAVDKWRSILGSDTRKIGIAWSGSKLHGRDFQRSIPLGDFLLFLNRHFDRPEGFELISLQPAKESLDGVRVLDIENFDDVAAIVPLMDTVITVDTAAAHIAGAIGHPNAHVLLHRAQDWRWYCGKSWYPTLHQHRQHKFGDWSSAFADLALALT